MQRDELVGKWAHKAAEYGGLAATVNAAAMCKLFVADLKTLATETHDDWVSIPEASTFSGYSQQQIRRWIKSGQLPSEGVGKARRVRLGDLPRKPPQLATANGQLHLFVATAEQAVRESVGSS